MGWLAYSTIMRRQLGSTAPGGSRQRKRLRPFAKIETRLRVGGTRSRRGVKPDSVVEQERYRSCPVNVDHPHPCLESKQLRT